MSPLTRMQGTIKSGKNLKGYLIRTCHFIGVDTESPEERNDLANPASQQNTVEIKSISYH